MERTPEVPASIRDEALFHCTEPSGVPRGPSQLHSAMGWRLGPGCHDRLTESMVGAPSQLGVPGGQTGTRMDGRMDRRADEFHKSKRAVPNMGGGSLRT